MTVASQALGLKIALWNKEAEKARILKEKMPGATVALCGFPVQIDSDTVSDTEFDTEFDFTVVSNDSKMPELLQAPHMESDLVHSSWLYFRTFCCFLTNAMLSEKRATVQNGSLLRGAQHSCRRCKVSSCMHKHK